MQMPEWKKILILIVGLLEILIFSGTILGWTSLKLMLKNERIYDYKCRPLSAQNATDLQLLASSESEKLPNATLLSSASASSSSSAHDTNRSLSAPSSLANISVQLNFTITADAERQSASLIESNNNNRSTRVRNRTAPWRRTIVIPFRAAESLNQSFVYTLLRDSFVVLRSNNSDVQLNLYANNSLANRTVAAATATGTSLVSGNISTLEQLINLYLIENLEPSPIFDSSTGSCAEQEVTLNLAFSIGSFCMGATGFVWGFLLERWGLRIVRLLINSMISFGAFLLCFTAKGNDWILFPAILIMGLGGVPIRIANMQFSNLYPARRSTIIAVYSGAFSASSIIYVVIESIYSGLSLSFFWVNFILVFFSLLMIPFTIFVLPADRIRENGETGPPPKAIASQTESSKMPTIDRNHNLVEEEKDSTVTATVDPGELFNGRRKSIFAISPITLQNYKQVSSPIVDRKLHGGFVNEAYVDDDFEHHHHHHHHRPHHHNRRRRRSSLSSSSSSLSYDSGGKGAILSPRTVTAKNELNNGSSNVITTTPTTATTDIRAMLPETTPPLWISLSSLPYNLHQLWFSWMITYMLLYVGSMNMWTARVTTDTNYQASFINIYGVVQVGALVISPLAGMMMDWKLARAAAEPDPLERRVKRIQAGFWPLLITTLTLLICVLCHYFDTHVFVYISIVFITVYRAFLLAVGSAFLRIRFHGDHFNRLLGIMSSVSAVTSLLQIPLFKWENSSQSNVVYVNIFNTILAIIVMSNPLYLMITPLQRYFLRKEDEQMQKSSSSSIIS